MLVTEAGALSARKRCPHAGVTLCLDQLVDTFEIIFGTLAGSGWCGHDLGLNTVPALKQTAAAQTATGENPAFSCVWETSGMLDQRNCESAPGVVVRAEISLPETKVGSSRQRQGVTTTQVFKSTA